MAVYDNDQAARGGDTQYDRPLATASTIVLVPTVRRSASIAALAAALAKAQGEIEGAAKDKTNPHFKSAYADLASIWDACRAPLSKHGLAVLQPVSADGPCVTVTTLLTHSSGEWIEADLPMTAAQNTPQGIGSCITYARRYALASMVGIAPEDDDGEAASRTSGTKPHAVAAQPTVPAGYEDWLLTFSEAANHGLAALRQTFKNAQPAYRDYVMKQDAARYRQITERAELTDKAKPQPATTKAS